MVHAGKQNLPMMNGLKHVEVWIIKLLLMRWYLCFGGYITELILHNTMEYEVKLFHTD
jgi:hypothetical protein